MTYPYDHMLEEYFKQSQNASGNTDYLIKIDDGWVMMFSNIVQGAIPHMQKWMKNRFGIDFLWEESDQPHTNVYRILYRKLMERLERWRKWKGLNRLNQGCNGKIKELCAYLGVSRSGYYA
jgi:hypothetical protein